MSQLKQFAFHSFDERKRILMPLSQAVPANDAQAVPAVSEEELKAREEQGYTKGYQEGCEKGLEEGRASRYTLDQTLAALLSTLETRLNGWIDEAHAETQAHIKNLAASALTIGKKLSHDALKACPEEPILALAKECMQLIRGNQDLAICVHESLVEAVKEKIASLKLSQDFPGEIAVLGKEEILPGDGEIRWKDGGARLNREALEKQIEVLIEKL